MQNIGNIKLKITYVTEICIIWIKTNAHAEADQIIIQATLVIILEPGQVNLHLGCASGETLHPSSPVFRREGQGSSFSRSTLIWQHDHDRIVALSVRQLNEC